MFVIHEKKIGWKYMNVFCLDEIVWTYILIEIEEFEANQKIHQNGIALSVTNIGFRFQIHTFLKGFRSVAYTQAKKVDVSMFLVSTQNWTEITNSEISVALFKSRQRHKSK